jgi:hypothetical protein
MDDTRANQTNRQWNTNKIQQLRRVATIRPDRDFSQPLKPTMNNVQLNAKQVIATATLKNIMTSEKV